MRRTEVLQEIRQMRFEEAYEGWTEKRFTQEEAARLLNVSDRTFRRYLIKYEEEGLEGLIDHRLNQISHRRAPVDEVFALTNLYCTRYRGWNVKHFYSFYKRKHSGTRGYTWVKTTLQKEGIVTKSSKRGAHRKKRERASMEGMMVHQDGSGHEWVPNEKKGLFCSFYTDRGSHYWTTPEVGGPVDKHNLTQFGRAMKYLGIEMIPAYSPEARGRSERAFRTHQERLTKELEMLGITTMDKANEYIKNIYMPAYNTEFAISAAVEGSAFVPWINGDIDDILCEQHERTVGKDNCVRFEGLVLQIPKDQYRCHYIKAKVRVHHYVNGQLAIFHGPRKLANYNAKGELKIPSKAQAA